MEHTQLSGVISVVVIVTTVLIMRWYAIPSLKKLELYDALVPLFLWNVLRILPLNAYAPGQVDPAILTVDFAWIAWGDFISAVLSLIAAFFLRNRIGGAITLAWIVNIVGLVDWFQATARAVSSGMLEYEVGWNWYIVNYYAMTLPVVHFVIFWFLIKKRD